MKKLSFLLIDDDEIEQLKFQRILKKLDHKHKVREANDGEEALELITSGNYIPDVILLDLNMPKMNGIDFLKLFKQHDSLRYIPIIMLTTSSNHSEIKQCYAEGASGYIIKPLKYEDYIKKVETLSNYWFENEVIRS